MSRRRRKSHTRPAKCNSCKTRDVFAFVLTVLLIVFVIGALAAPTLQNAFDIIFAGDSAEDVPNTDDTTTEDTTPPEDSGGSDTGDNDADGSGDWDDNMDPDGWTDVETDSDLGDTPLLEIIWD